jgi:hypothetical protein
MGVCCARLSVEKREARWWHVLLSASDSAGYISKFGTSAGRGSMYYIVDPARSATPRGSERVLIFVAIH